MTQPYDFRHVQGTSGLTLPFQCGEWASPAQASQLYALGMLTARPFFVGDSGAKVNRVGLNLFSTHYASLCRVGIYACPPPSAHNMYPTTLIADLGDLNMFGSALPFITAGSPIELGPGYHYVATRVSAPTTSVPAFGAQHGEANTGGPGFPLGYNPVSGDGHIGFSAYNPPGPLPATFPAVCPRRYSVLMDFIVNPPTAIYMEASAPYTTTDVQVQWTYDALHVGAPDRPTDTATQVYVRFGPSTPVADVVAAFEASVHIENGAVFNVGATTTMPNATSSTIPLQPGGPLQSSASQVGRFFPATAIEVVL